MSRFHAQFVLAALTFLPAAGWAQTIPDQIDAILARPAVATNTWTVLVENSDGSVIYYQRNPYTGLAPASNTKMFTTAAAFGLLGTNYSFQTRVYWDGTLTNGILTGNLNLVSEHDLTWNTTVFSSARAGLDRIATQLKALGLTNVSGNVQCYGMCTYGFGSTGNIGATTTQAKNATAATAFLAALQAQGIAVSGSALGQTGFAPPGTLFYTHESSDLTYGGKPLRLDVACIPLMKVSHNAMADALCRHLGWKLGAGDSYSAGAAQVLRWIHGNAGISTNAMVMNDGSGLSHGNRFSARQCLLLTRYMLAAFPTWDDTLPIGCVDGTIGSRFCGTDGSGQVHAKTGSLSISIALSGYIDNENDNRRYLFSFIANKADIDQSATRNAIDNCVVLLGARGVPVSPALTRVSSQPDGTSLKLTWSDEDFVRTGYRIYASPNGVTFGPPINVAANVHTYTDSGLTPATKRYYKVSVVSPGGESKASRTYGAQTGGSPRVLIVDGNDRWQFLTAENPTCTNHAFAAIAGQNISGPGFETAHHDAVINGTVQLAGYPAVVWLLGEEGAADRSFDTIEQSLVTAYLNAGGNLFVSGSECGYDLDRSSGPAAADRSFYHDQLRAVYSSDDANTYAFSPAAGGIFAGNSAGGFDNGTRGTYNVNYPDVMVPTNGSRPAITYSGGLGGVAAVQYDGSLGGGKVVNFGFPFETITNSVARDACMSDVLRFFGVLDSPALLPAQLDSAGHTLTLTWTASAGLKYRVQYATNLPASAWQALGADVIATNTTAFQVDSTLSGAPQRFYRVLLVE
ncbi:MAG TPA: D-alanyl-D-alanine carboxypeptidase [Candidatus Paceibacterota bacterium]|nr:D-alanyl-D-alanine carboxypeptidase [Verrucomicrobiota bacterium]HSA12956.1 D-alanyl-D-alanine carboxypeptidase [Candidatus Paceibacterota bacterium]